MIKVVGIVLTALIINIVLKNYSKEFTFLINIVCTIIIFTLISKDLKGIVDRLTSISNEISVLLIHSQDHLMNGMTVLDKAEEFINLYELVKK